MSIFPKIYVVTILVSILLTPYPTLARDLVCDNLVDKTPHKFKRSILAERLARIKQIVSAITGNNESAWSCTFGGCIPTSKKLLPKLTNYGAFKRVRVEGFEKIMSDGKAFDAYSLHVFITYKPSRQSEEIIVDPTYLQFFSKKIHDEYPRIFIGTRTHLINFFTKHLSELQTTLPEPGRRIVEDDAAAAVDRVYGFGEYARNRMKPEDELDL